MAATQRTALVVGASRGLGLGLATELHARVWAVIGTVRTPQKAGGLQKLAATSAGQVQVETLDVDSRESVESLARRLAGKPLDLLFINAGISGASSPIERASDEELLAVLRTNTLGPIRIAQRLLPQVVDGGRIAFMTSMLGSITDNESGGYDLYRLSKASLNMLTRSFVATSAKDRDVTVLSLHPGWVRTDMGGPAAPVSVEQSAKGLVDVLEARASSKHQFLDYQGHQLSW